MSKTKSNNKFLQISIGALIIIVLVSLVLNLNSAKDKAELTDNKEIVIKINDEVTDKITPEDLNSLENLSFTATLKSSGNDPLDVDYTGVPMADILDNKNIDLDEKQTVTMGSIDGYTVNLTPGEILDRDNVWLVWEEDGQKLNSKSAPYMVIIRKDPFSQRWSKQLCEISIS